MYNPSICNFMYVCMDENVHVSMCRVSDVCVCALQVMCVCVYMCVPVHTYTY